jgi:RHS repeat-associated protein
MTGGGTFAGTFLSSASSFALRPNGQQWFETFGTDPLSGVVAVHRDLPGGLSLNYSSDTAVAKPIVAVDTTWNSTSLPTGPLTATLKIGGVTQSSVTIDHTGIQQGSPLRIVLQATSNLPSGKYDAQIDVIAPTGMYSLTQTLTQNVLVENRESSPFGRGWTVTGLEQLVPQAGGTVFLSGAGYKDWYGSTGMAMPGMMANSPLVQQTDQTWRLNLPDGGYHTFDVSGRLTSKVDGLGNTITYGWDSISGLLTSVSDVFGRITNLNYLNGKLSSVVDFAGRFVNLTHDANGQLQTITSHSAAAMGPWAPPVMTYSYNAEGLLASSVDQAQRTTLLTYSFSGRLASAVLPNGGTWSFAPVALVGLANTASGVGTTTSPATRTLPANALATWTNPLGGIQQLAVDTLGNVVRSIDPLGAETGMTRDANGRVLTVTQPDPDGSGSLPAPVTTSVYDTSGNQTQLTLPSGAVRTWTYNAQNLPLTAVDELGRTTTYAWNSNRTLASTTSATGVTTTLTYNTRGQQTSVTIPDPDGTGPLMAATVTSVYDTLGRKTSQTNPDGSSKSWTYNALDQVESVTDELGRTTSYQYSWIGRVAAILLPDPDGSGPLPQPTVAYNFDGLGCVDGEFQNNVLLKTYTYDVNNKVSSTTLIDPDGTGPLTNATSTINYDLLGRAVSQTNSAGATSTVTYDAAGRVLTSTGSDPDGSGPLLAAVTTYSYDALGRTKTVANALGGITTLSYNAAGFQTSVTNALGYSSSSTYNVAGQVLTSTNALGETTSFAYDAYGNTTSVTLPDPDGSGDLPAPVMTSTYDVFGRTISSTAPDGGVSTVQYDINGRTIKQTAADGSFVTMVYDVAGQVTSQTVTGSGASQLSLTSTIAYDGLGRAVSATDPAGTVSSVYDANGNLVSVTDATGQSSTFEYDKWGRQIKSTDALGHSTTVVFNAVGLTQSVIDGLNHATTYAYDNSGRLTSSTDANGGVTTYEYDVLGRSARLIDPVGNATSWTYDAVGQMLTDTQVLPDSGAATRTYLYDAAGQVTSRTDRNGRTITFGYDHLGRQIQQNWLESGIGSAAVNTISTTYNAAMRVTSIADNDAVNSFTWDIMGRLTSSSNAGTTNATPVVLTNSYDSLGRRSGLSASVNSVADFVNAYSYDTTGRMTQITQTDGNSSAGDAVKDKRVDISYDSIGRFTSIARYESLNTTNPIASTAFSYDTAGHLTSLQHTGFNNGAAASSSMAGYSYTWDAADRLTSMNSVRDGLSTYSYDASSQLTAADHTGQTDESFTYDANGNRTSVTLGAANGSSTVTAHNRILNDGKSTYTYDAEGNRTSKTDIATGHKVEYSWNHANQLIAVVYKTYNNTVTKSVEYQYDALGRRIGKSVDDNGDSTMDRRETFVYDGAGLLADAAGSIHIGGPNGALNQAGWTDQLLFQFTDADADGASSSPVATRFFTGPAVDQIFAVESASGDPLWALTDNQGTPRDWVQQTTVNGNSSTTIAQHIRFTAFGAISSVVDSTGNPIDANLVPLSSFTGQLYDADAGLMYYRARWYDPVLGKFLNDDPMGFAAGDANVTRYVGNAVNFRFDATGLYDEPIYDPKDPDEIFHQILPPFLHPSFTEPTISDVLQDVAHAVLDPYKDELINVLELKPKWLVGVGTAGVGVGVVLVDQGVINEVPLPPKKIFSLPLTEHMILTQSVAQTWELGNEPWRLNDDLWRITPTTQLAVDLTDFPWILPPWQQVYIFETRPQISFPFYDPTKPTFVYDIGIHTAE